MIPVVTPEEMRAIDEAAPIGIEVLIERAGWAVARSAARMVGARYGTRVLVVAGKGANGADGRVAARHLAERGAQVVVVEPGAATTALLDRSDLVIDAAYGTGLSRPYEAPVTTAHVLAVDISSGVNALTGELLGTPQSAAKTVTFDALKPGHLLQPGASLHPSIEVASIGLDVTRATAGLFEESDAAAATPTRTADAHKWRSAVLVVAGSPSMTGAATLAASAAMRAGAGYAHIASPGTIVSDPVEAVSSSLDGDGWAADAIELAKDRVGAVLVGPGLGRTPDVAANVGALIAGGSPDVAMVIDADGLSALGPELLEATAAASQPCVLTPHDGEFESLIGHRPGADRFAAARELAQRSKSTVLLKGATTIVASPGGQAIAVTAGDARLATAGTGDVLAGIITALLAAGGPGSDPLTTAALGAYLHGRSGAELPARGLVASDLLTTLPYVMEALRGD